MKSLFPTSKNAVEKVQLDGDRACDVYVWTSPEGVKIAAHMILHCPECTYPLSLATSEFDFDSRTLNHKLKCPARWKKTQVESIDGVEFRVTELNEKGKPTIQRCGWQGFIRDGRLLTSH